METVSKAYEDEFMLIKAGGPLCANAEKCKGHTARTVHGRALGKTLRAFRLPSGREFPTCVLCVRASVSARWYEVLFTEECPLSPIHDWAVEVDESDEYDSATCIGPLGGHRYVGVQAAFPRYDETTLLVVPDGFVQIGVDYRTIPRLLRANERVGARPLGFHWLWRTTYALLYAGFVSKTEGPVPGHVAEIYAKCVSRSHYGNAKWDAAVSKVQRWIDGVVRASALGIYPHCRVKYADSNDEWTYKHVQLFVMEHVTFLIERDSPELGEAVRRAYPNWAHIEADVRETCDSLRRRDHRVARAHSVRKFADVRVWSTFVRKHLPEPSEPSFSPLVDEMRLRYMNGEDALAWMRSLPESDALALSLAAAWDGWKDRFSTRTIVSASASVIWWYLCSACGMFKSVTSKWGGCNEVRLDLATMTVRCHKKRGVGRKPVLTHIEKTGCTEFTTSGCSGLIVKRPFGTHVVNIDFKAYVSCVGCAEALVPLDFKRVVLGRLCDACSSPQTKAACEVCTAPVPADAAMCIQAFEKDKGLRNVYFCRAHARPKLKNHAEVWSLDLLMNSVYASKKRLKL